MHFFCRIYSVRDTESFAIRLLSPKYLSNPLHLCTNHNILFIKCLVHMYYIEIL